jgi:TPR repeat protein
MSGFLTRPGWAFVLLAAALSAGTAQAQGSADPPGCPDVESAEACYLDGLALAEKALLSAVVSPATLRPALERFRGACLRGLGDACYVAGRLLAADTSRSRHQGAVRSISRGENVLDLFHAGCDAPERPSAAACNALSITSKHARGISDEDSVLHHLRHGCDRENPTACALAATFVDDWTGSTTRTTTVRAGLEHAACGGGSPAGCMQVADRTRTLLSLAPASARATPAYRRQRSAVYAAYRDACARGMSPACTRLGTVFTGREMGFPAQLDSASRYFDIACNGPGGLMGNDSSWVPDGAGCAGMGRLLLRTGGVQRDTEAALAWLEDGCTLLDSDACADVAYHGLPSGTVTLAVARLRALTACFEGSGYGCWVAGWLYQQTGSEGRGNAQQYLRQACDLAYAPGCTALAGMLGGDRVADAFKHLRRACVLGDGEGCAAYGSLLATQDAPGEAYYHVVACENGYAQACWLAMEHARASADPVREGEYRSRACRLDRTYCKRPG